jgi:hypothetical protein
LALSPAAGYSFVGQIRPALRISPDGSGEWNDANAEITPRWKIRLPEDRLNSIVHHYLPASTLQHRHESAVSAGLSGERACRVLVRNP